MIGNVVIAFAALTAVLVTLDLILSEAAKQRVSDAAASTWLALDEMRRASVQSWVGRGRTRFWIFGAPLAGAAALEGWVLLNHDKRFELSAGGIALITLPIAAASAVGIYATAMALKSTSIARSAVYGAVVFAVAQVPLYATSRMIVAHQGSFFADGQPTIIALLSLVAFIFVAMFTAALMIWWASLVAVIASMFAAGMLLSALELLFRRAAEYPKGPILAFSIVAGSIAAIAKALSS